MFSSTSSSTGIEVSLSDQETWKKFHPKTEMIVTKRKGRVIFPHLNYNIKGLDPGILYAIAIHLERVDNIKLRWNNGGWEEAAKGDPILPIQYKEHKDGARSGDHWMKDIVSFSNVKITNDPENSDKNLILVQSMHKYVPVITIRKVGDCQREEFRLRGTEFIAVTAYQNEAMIELKIKTNKFASGKRRNSSDSENRPPSEPKRRSTSSSSNTPTPPTVSPPNWNTLNPVVFNQNSQNSQFPGTYSMVPNQYFDFTAGANPLYWNCHYQAQWLNWSQMNMNTNMNMNTWTAQATNTSSSDNTNGSNFGQLFNMDQINQTQTNGTAYGTHFGPVTSTGAMSGMGGSGIGTDGTTSGATIGATTSLGIPNGENQMQMNMNQWNVMSSDMSNIENTNGVNFPQF